MGPLQLSEGAGPCPHPDFGLLASGRVTAVVLSCLVVALRFRGPRELTERK